MVKHTAEVNRIGDGSGGSGGVGVGVSYDEGVVDDNSTGMVVVVGWC